MHCKGVAQALKEFMAREQISYADLADRSGISLSTLKKSMANGDFPLSRLIKICEVLNLTLADVHELVEGENEIGTLNAEQEQYFLSDLDSFRIFSSILNYRKLNLVREALDIDRAILDNYVRDFESLGLLDRLEEDKIKIKIEGVLTLADNSLLQQKLETITSNVFINNYHECAEEAGVEKQLHVGSMSLSPKNLRKIIVKLDELNADIARKSALDARVLPESELKRITYMVGIGPINSMQLRE